MSIQVKCGVCSRQFAAPEEARGRRFKCPACSNAIEVPGAIIDDDLFEDLRWKAPLAAAPPVAPPPLDPFLAQTGTLGGGSLPPVRVKSRPIQVQVEGGLIDFIGNHKLVLVVLACGISMLWLGSAWERQIAGMILMFVGVILGIGAWRSQKLADRHDKEAEDWRYLERVFGIIVLLAIAGYFTVRVGIILYASIDPIRQVGFTPRVVGFLTGVAIAWAIVIGYCVLMHFLSDRFGFFKPAGWSFVVVSFLCFGLLVLSEVDRRIWLQLRGQPDAFAEHANRQPPPEMQRPRPERRGRMVERDRLPPVPLPRVEPRAPGKQQPKLSEKDYPTLSMGRLSGIPEADELSTAADPAAKSIAAVKLGEGPDGELGQRRPAVRWTAKADPQISNLKSQIPDSKAGSATATKRLAQVPLATGDQVIVPRGAGPWLAVASGGKETAKTIRLFNLLTHAERKIEGRIALGPPHALSPDGKYFAAFNTLEKAVDVWSFESGKSIARLRIAPLEKPTVVEFAAGDRLIVAGDVGNRFDAIAHCNAWELPSGTSPRKIAVPRAVKFGDGMATVSPGGKYLAAYDDGSVWIIDLETGTLRGKVKIDERDRSEQFHTRPAGLSFSASGEELVCFVRRFRGSRLAAWSMKDGSVLADHRSEAEFDDTRHSDRKALESFPDGKAWLVDGRAIVDAKIGEPAWLGLDYKDSIFEKKLTVYGLVDGDRLIVGSPKMITTWSIPRDLSGNIERQSLVVSADDLPSGMLPEPDTRRLGFDDDDEEQTLSGEELELASRKYRQAAQLKVLAGNDDKLASLLGWYPAAKRQTFGLRVGLGAQAPDGSKELIPLSSTASLAEFTGPVGPKIVTELRKRFAQDAFGDWPQTEDSAARGVVFVGIGPREKVLPAAKAAELDVVLMLEVTRQQIGNTKRFDMLLRARVTDSSGEPVWVSPALSSEKAMAAERDKQDLVKPFIEEVFAKIDETYTLKAMPEAKADAAKERVKAIVKGDTPPADRLTAAAELRHYQIAGVLTAEEALLAYHKLFDEETAAAMASGDVRLRRAALEKWASENAL